MTEATTYKIGIDVGGTNTDAVLLDLNNKLFAKIKCLTSLDVISGITEAIKNVIQSSNVPVTNIKYIMLGTTHCTNALVERVGLNKVAVIRLCLPAAQIIPPFYDVPKDISEAMKLKSYLVKGGYEFNGQIINDIDEAEIKNICFELKGSISSLAIAGVFSNINPAQEIQVKEIAEQILGSDFPITMSHQIGGIGLLDRENAAIINAALQDVAKKMVISFQNAVASFNLNATLYIGQNDGTLMSLEQALKFPVSTISCGPTNSIRGAGYLSGCKDAIVIDVGGTTADAGVIVNGFPRESLLAANIGGIKTNFRMPDVISIALGGGTIIKEYNGNLILQKKSVGYNITTKALAFGGDTFTLSDIAIANGILKIAGAIGIAALQVSITAHCKMAFEEVNNIVQFSIRNKIEELIDKLKTSKQQVDVIMVGGGSVIIPPTLVGIDKVLFPEHFEVANAFGAAIAQIGGEGLAVFNLNETTRQEAKQKTINMAIENAISNGAKVNTIQILNIEELPLAYLPDTIKIKVKVFGEI